VETAESAHLRARGADHPMTEYDQLCMLLK
jgi:hypothetical protein